METLTRLHLVMEYVAGGDLNKRISMHGKFTENEAKIIFAQLIAAVNHLVSVPLFICVHSFLSDHACCIHFCVLSIMRKQRLGREIVEGTS